MTDNTQPEALRLADEVDEVARTYPDMAEVSAELRRQHARITELEAQLESIGAGGVSGPLMGQPQAMPDLSQLTERGAKAWTGVDAQGLRDGVAPGAEGAGSEPVALRWWCFDQNNSGGYFITNDTVAEYVFIQARNATEAVAKAEAVFVDHSEYCDCCGERWSYYVGEDDGKQTPEIYGTRIENVGPGIFRKEARLHHFDGHIQAYKLGEPIPGLLIDKFAPPTNPAGSGKGE